MSSWLRGAGRLLMLLLLSALALQAYFLIRIALMIAAATLMTWTAKQDRPGPKLF